MIINLLKSISLFLLIFFFFFFFVLFDFNIWFDLFFFNFYYYFLFHLVPFVQTVWKAPLFLPQLRQFLAGSFSQMQEPSSGLLDLLEGCATVQKGKTTSPSQFILSEFMRWRTSNPQASLNVLREEERLRLQQRALGLLTDSHPGFMDPLLEVYQLSSLSKPLLLAHVFFLQDLRCFKEVWGGSFTTSAYQKRVARGRNVHGPGQLWVK